MSGPTDENVLSQLARAQGEFSLSIHRVLTGFYREVGGPEKFGKRLGSIFNSEEVTPSTVVTLGTNILKLTVDSSGEGDEDNGLVTDEQIIAKMQMLDKEDQ